MIDAKLYCKPFHESRMSSFFSAFVHVYNYCVMGDNYIADIIFVTCRNKQPYLGRGKLFSEGLNAFDGLDGTEMNGCNGIETALLTDNLC